MSAPGVTAIRPHGGNVYFDRVPAAMHVGNGFGKLLGVTQVGELGELETPILLTCTLCVWKAADAMVEWALAMEGMDGVRSINPVVGEDERRGSQRHPQPTDHPGACARGAGERGPGAGRRGCGRGRNRDGGIRLEGRNRNEFPGAA